MPTGLREQETASHVFRLLRGSTVCHAGGVCLHVARALIDSGELKTGYSRIWRWAIAPYGAGQVPSRRYNASRVKSLVICGW